VIVAVSAPPAWIRLPRSVRALVTVPASSTPETKRTLRLLGSASPPMAMAYSPTNCWMRSVWRLKPRRPATSWYCWATKSSAA